MKSLLSVLSAVALLGLCASASSQSASESAVASSDGGGVPIERLLAAVSKKTGKSFLVDPRVHADIHLVGQDLAKVDYAELLTILQLYGYVALEQGDVVRVFPDAGIRNMAVPQVTATDRRPNAEVVSTVIPVKNVPAVQLVPILRPLLPQYAHLAALPCTNNLLMVDRFDNVRRIEALVHTLDTGEPFKVSCRPSQEEPASRPHQEGSGRAPGVESDHGS